MPLPLSEGVSLQRERQLWVYFKYNKNNAGRMCVL